MANDFNFDVMHNFGQLKNIGRKLAFQSLIILKADLKYDVSVRYVMLGF